ncbi:MAG TPA: hypothetical protein VMB75_09220 [Rhodocyclaceae bacterium]|nr:hypothetical protein [Rhodocyclaceae bacterium]
MGSSGKESFEEFLEQLKRAGVEISNERELRDRLAEARFWRYAFSTLVANGHQIGIDFCERATGIDMAQIRRALADFAFPERDQTRLSAALRAH